MATPEVIAEQQALVGINDDYEKKFGFHDPETGYAFKAPKGLTRELVEQISEFKDEPQWMLDFRLKALDHFLAPPPADVGLADAGRRRLRQHPLLRPRVREVVADVGRRAGRHQAHVRQARHPGGGAQVPRRRRRAVRVRGRLPPGPRGPGAPGRRVHGHGLRPARARGHRAASTSPRSSRPTTTSSPRSTRRSGRAARSSTSPRACTSRCRCRPTSGSTPRTWASSSGR